MTTAEVIPFAVLKAKIDDRDITPEAIEEASFSPEVEADVLTNLLVSGLYKGMTNSGIDTLSDVNQELLGVIYEMVGAVVDRKYKLFNEFNAIRDIQAEKGDVQLETNVFLKPKQETTDA